MTGRNHGRPRDRLRRGSDAGREAAERFHRLPPFSSTVPPCEHVFTIELTAEPRRWPVALSASILALSGQPPPRGTSAGGIRWRPGRLLIAVGIMAPVHSLPRAPDMHNHRSCRPSAAAVRPIPREPARLPLAELQRRAALR